MFSSALPLEVQPSGNTLLIIARLRERRSGEFAPLSEASAANDARGLRIEPTRTKGAPPFGGHERDVDAAHIGFFGIAGVFSSRDSGFGGRFRFGVGFDPPGRMWWPLTADLAQVAVVGKMSRANSKNEPRVAASINGGRDVRTYRMDTSHPSAPMLTMDGAIQIVDRRHSFWPLMRELRKVKTVENAKGRKGDKGD